MTALNTLNPRWVGAGGTGVTDKDGNPVPERRGVGITFDCPCGTCGTQVFISFSNPLDGGPPHDPRPKACWERTGDDLATLTIRPSIQRVGGCNWHGFVTNGQVTP